MASLLRVGGASFSFDSVLDGRERALSEETARGSPSPSPTETADEALVERRRIGRLVTAGREGVSSFPSCSGGSVRSCDSESSAVEFWGGAAAAPRAYDSMFRRGRTFSEGNGVVACDVRRGPPAFFAVVVVVAEDEGTIAASVLRTTVDGTAPFSSAACRSFSSLSCDICRFQ